MTLLALRFHAPFPGRHSILWAAIAGLFGGFALAIFYRALAKGNMGLTAPVAAVLGAAIPTMFATVTEGMPGPVPVSGFFLAGIGIWLISRVEDSAAAPRGLALRCWPGSASRHTFCASSKPAKVRFSGWQRSHVLCLFS